MFAVRLPNKFVIVPQKKEDVNATSLASFVLVGAEGLATALAFARFALRLSLPLAVGALTRTALRKRRSLHSFYLQYACQINLSSYHKKKKMSMRHLLLRLSLWELRDSNPRPSACKADALNQLS